MEGLLLNYAPKQKKKKKYNKSVVYLKKVFWPVVITLFEIQSQYSQINLHEIFLRIVRTTHKSRFSGLFETKVVNA